MSDPPPPNEWIRANEQEHNGNNGGNEEEASRMIVHERPGDPRQVTFVYTGQPIEENPRNITHLVIDPSIERIERAAFQSCWLRNVTIPPTVEAIGNSSFLKCASLTKVHLHEGCLKSIGTGAFYRCTSLLEMVLPNGITEISKATFAICKSLRMVSLPITLKKIGPNAFAECISLVDISLPNGLKRIELVAFKGCQTLSSVALPSSLEFVGSSAFRNCKNLMSVEIPSISIPIQFGMGCFQDCESLVNVSIPKSVPDSASLFSRCPIPDDKRECLRERFENHPIHSLCYESSSRDITTREQVMGVFDDSANIILDEFSSSLKDAFDMTPFHILATSASLNQEILDCLLLLLLDNSNSSHHPMMKILAYKDCYGNTMMDYLLKHTSPRVVPLLQSVLRFALIHTVSTWNPGGTNNGDNNNLSIFVEELSIPHNNSDNMEMRRQCVKDFFGRLGYCCRIEITSVVELAVWKLKLSQVVGGNEPSSLTEEEEEAVAIVVAVACDNIERDSCRYQSDGAGIVIENVIGYLWEGESTSETALSLFPLCSM